MSNKIALKASGCLLVIVALAACSSESSRQQSNIDPYQPLTVPPSNSRPILGRSGTPPPFKPSPPALPPALHDPVNDRSEGGIRLNIQQADENKAITYAHLKKNAEEYDGEPWAFTGKIYQIQESGEQTTALVSLDAWGNKLMWMKANFTTEFVENNQVYVVGYLSGNYSYTSVAGWNVTVPAIEARAILKPAEASRLRGKKSTK